MKYEWVKSIPNYIDFFDEDHRLIIDIIGIDKYFELFDIFGKTGIYFPSSSIRDLKKEWIALNSTSDYKSAAYKLDVSIKTIYRWYQEKEEDSPINKTNWGKSGTK